ncbi:putative streptogramin lyase [Plesiocystis pacifica SIR-1]|uniref:Putative streptogramin lyase n=1 Tax=Plesiocystis pacifica SIR-1 TaxID=391625 RepID=A6GID4_9BACT|nr:hypothetical protein [Plesiocystis pacifica]EDM74387.1 putative streptogramin lyase [Plesiocystis pacifica SIR-1]
MSLSMGAAVDAGSSDDEVGASEGPETSTDTSASSGSGESTGSDGSTADTTDTDEGTETTAGRPCDGSEGFDFSYLWVANTTQGSVSKVNTATMVEEARYITGPHDPGWLSPSRTTVSLDGRLAMVGNRRKRSVTMIAANVADCVDQDQDGVITTSTGPEDLLPFGEDECVLWTTALPDAGGGQESGPRGMGFEPGELNLETCAYEDPKVWVGWHGGLDTHAHMARLDPLTGAVEGVASVHDWDSGWNEYAPYGAAYDGAGHVWFTALRGDLFRVDTGSFALERWTAPAAVQAYGMSVDPNGDPWFGGCTGPVSMFDADTETFTTVEGTHACHRGVAADTLGNIWVASNSPCGLVQIDRDSRTLIAFHGDEYFDHHCAKPVGVSVDVEGFVWLVDQEGWAWKIDPETLAKEHLLIPGNHYTYSDMTGGGLSAVVHPQ